MRFLPPKEFYRETAKIAVPVALQYLLSSCLGLIDTMMVSKIGMVSAVGTAVQIDSMNTLLTLGATSGTAIFLAQYMGAKNDKCVKRTFGLSIILSAVMGLIFLLISGFFATPVMKFYTSDEQTLLNAVEYLQIAKYGFLPSSIAYAFIYAFRSAKNAKIPLWVNTLKMLMNIVLNAVFIFGLLGFPAMGVRGVAIATVISQWCGLAAYLLLAIYTKQQFIGSLSEMFYLKLSFVGMVLKRIYTLIINEVFFGFGETLYVKAFSSLGIAATDAYFVGSKISDVFYILIMGITNAATVILGSALGEGDIQKAKKSCGHFYIFAAVLSLISVISILIFSEPMVMLFGIEDAAAVTLATEVVRVLSVKIALRLFIGISFSALRAGGDSKFLTFLDSGIMWLVGIPLTFLTVNVFQISSIALVLLFIQLEHLVRTLVGAYRLKSGKWAVNLTEIPDNS